MKNAKRVLIGVLVLAMLVSGLFISTMADEGSLESYADILKYYDPATSQVYCEADFEDGSYDVDAVVIDEAAAEHTSIAVVGESNKYLEAKLGHILNTLARTHVLYEVAIPEGRSELIVRCSVSANHTDRYGAFCTECSASFSYADEASAPESCTTCGAELQRIVADAPVFNVYLGETGNADEAVLKFDYSNGGVYYYNGSEYSVVEGLSISEDTWYAVDLLYLGSTYNFTITTGSGDDKAVYTVEGAHTPFFVAYGAAFGVGYADDNRDTSFSLDDIYVQAGHEDLYHGVDLVALTDEALTAMNDVLSGDNAVADKLAAIYTFEQLMDNYGDALAKSENTDTLIDSINESIVLVHSVSVEECVTGIDKTADYGVRVQHVETYAALIEDVRALVAEYPDAEVSAMIALYDEELADLAETKVKAEKFIADIMAVRAGTSSGVLAGFDGSIFSSEVCDDLNDFVEAVEANYDVDSTYTGITEAYELYSVTAARHRAALAKAAAFVEYVNTAYNTENELNARLSAYAAATSEGGRFSNETYPGVTEALAKLGELASLEDISTVAKRFLTNVATATASEYLPTTLELIDVALLDYDTVNEGYAGVVEAKATLDALILTVAAKQQAAADYIAAVDALSGLSGSELLAAIEVALEKQVAGNVPGIDGVTEANIILHTVKTTQEFIQASADKFIRLVDAIEDAKSLAERHAAINLAIAARDAADDSIDGVIRAKSELVAAISSFNADVDAINSQYESVLTNAADLSDVGMAKSDIASKAISFIKSLVD